MAFALPVIHLSAQLSDRDAFYVETKLKAFPPIGNVSIKNNLATSPLSLSRSALADSLHAYTKGQLEFGQQVTFDRYTYSNISLPGLVSPGGIHLLDNGLNYSTVQPRLEIRALYSEGKAWPLVIHDPGITSSEAKRFTINSYGHILTKPENRVDSMEVAYTYTFCTEAEIIALSPQNPVYQKEEETIRLIRTEDNRIEIKVNYPAFERIVRIEGKNSKNKRMASDLIWTSGYISKELVKLYTDMESADWVRGAITDPDKEDDGYMGYPMTANFPSPPSEIQLFLSTRTDSISGTLMVYPAQDVEEEQEIGVFNRSGKAGVINSRGKVLIEPSYHSLEYIGGIMFYGQPQEDAHAELLKLDLSGQTFGPVGYTYDKPSSWSDPCEGQIKVYEYLEEPHNDSFIKYGVIDVQGNTIVPVIYDRVVTCAFDSQLILVRQYENGSKYRSLDGLYNSRGEQLLPVKYETIDRVDFYLFEACTTEDQDPEFYQYDPVAQQLTPTGSEWVEYEISAPETE